MEEINLEERRAQVLALREKIMTLIPPANRADGMKAIEQLSQVVAMTATDIAIKAATEQFVAKIKEAAEAGKAQAEAQTKSK